MQTFQIYSNCITLALSPVVCNVRAMKTRLGCLSNKSDSCSDFSEFLPPAQERSTRYLKLSTDEVTRWADSFDALLSNKYGLAAFRTFLKTEFSDENIEFWLACEDYKKIKSPAKMMSKANKIYKEFIDVHAPREVNIDHRTREETKQRLLEPTPNSLNEVQAKVYSLMEKDSYPRLTLEECLMWKQSLEKLLSSKHGLYAFRAFLKSEFSEENIAFYLACEDYKSTKSAAKMPSKAKRIYEEFIGSEAPREVNIDYETRDITQDNLKSPTASCFDMAQYRIYILMEKDCYPRFLRSAAYRNLVNQLTVKSAKARSKKAIVARPPIEIEEPK
ncbi:hypothetical protein cypCar_00029263 [Cyprinus carpio]|nr:hypothetical protein cypCar_00029263 [Cyprinus carpio]